MNEFALKTISELRKNKLIKNIAVVGIITIIIKFITFYKEILIAGHFGLSRILDTFYIAILIPTFIQSVFVSSLKSLFVPNYIKELDSTKQIGSFQSFTLLSLILLSIIFTIFTILFANLGLDILFQNKSILFYTEIKYQIYIISPSIIIWGISSFLSGLLEIKEKFLLSSISQIFPPLVVIICLLFFSKALGQYVLSIGISLGSLISLIYLFLFNFHHKTLTLSKVVLNENIYEMINQYKPKVLSSLLTGINPFIDQYFAATLVVGSITAIQFGIKIPVFLIGIFIIILNNIFLPYFSKLFSKSDNEAYTKLFLLQKITFVLCSLITLIIFFFSNEIISILFERNQFNTADTRKVGLILKIAVLQIPFYAVTLLNVVFLTAGNENHFMAKISLFNLLANIILNIIFISYFGIYGLVLSTTIIYIIVSTIYYLKTIKLFKSLLITE